MSTPGDHNTPAASPATPLPVIDAGTRERFRHHPRKWQDFDYVYPVVSRRSLGLSVGVNLNIDKACNFDCVYCCVDRTQPPTRRDIDLAQLEAELDRMLELVANNTLWSEPKFNNVAQDWQRLNDIALSGDGEPTAYTRFDEACRVVARVKAAHGLDNVKIVVITNATLFDRPTVQRGLEVLDANAGEIWAKLDAGTEDYYRQIERTTIPLARVLENILACGKARPLVLQSLFMTVRGQPVPIEEFAAYLDRVGDLLAAGCLIKSVQLYTTARATAESYITPLKDTYLDRLGERFRARFPDTPLGVYHGAAN